MALVTTEGDAGDATYVLAILNHLPNGPHSLLIEEKSDFTNIGKAKEGAIGLLNFIQDFALDQPYISECRLMHTGDGPFWRSGGFRGAGLHRRSEPLMLAHLNHLNQTKGLGLKVDTSKPWLCAYPSQKSSGRVIVNRTNRYTNPRFPWQKITDYYRERIIFLGLPHEYAAFCAEFGPVEFVPTQTMKQMAELIAGSRLFIGNQSCANAIAEGLKHPTIQETSLQIPDCVFKRDNAQHVWDGGCTLPNLDGGEPMTIPSRGLSLDLVSTMKTPPSGWQFPGVFPTDFFDQCLEQVSRLHNMQGKKQKDIENLIKQYTLDRVPDYYRPSHDGDLPRQALAFAETL